MIFVERTAVPNPFLETSLANKAAKELEIARGEITKGGGQRRPLFSVYKSSQVKAALNTLFHGKCAYCESQVGAVGHADVEQFRPKSGVSESPDHPGYWWLANDWNNLLLACLHCNRQSKTSGPDGRSELTGKANRFPLIDEKQRAYKPEDNLALEQPLILDPTVDDPAHDLTFTDDGHVFSETERGNATISILGLNRFPLVQARFNTARLYERMFGLLADLLKNDAFSRAAHNTVDDVREFTASGAAYAGMVRQFLQRDILRLQKDVSPQAAFEIDRLGASLPTPTEQAPAATPVRVKRAARSTKAYRERMANYSLANEEGIRRYKSQRREVQSISIRNIRGIRNFDVDLRALGAGAGRWLMLLGENGTGKSTVLQAIALVLGGSDYVSKLVKEERITLSDLVRFRCRFGEVAVKLSGFDAPHRLKVFRNRLEFTSPAKATAVIYLSGEVKGAAWEAQTIMAGYGATRLPPRRGRKVMAGGQFARAENLFDPFVPLINAQAWLVGLGKTDFDRTAIVLKDLLAIDPDAYLRRKKGRVLVHTAGATVSLSSLSVGYQTIVAATVDILEILSRVWPNPLSAEGIVLIDELDAHLHPSWQMQIVNSLRRALPGVQFITTTHQPLCLRGLVEGEVVVMRRDENHQIEVISDLPSPADFRVDQLLTSPFFGLNSTVDPETERLFDRYYALLAMDARTEREEVELNQLTADLEERRQFGETQREGLYLEAIDRVLARRKVMPAIPQKEVRKEAVQEISAIWDRLISEVTQDSQDSA